MTFANPTQTEEAAHAGQGGFMQVSRDFTTTGVASLAYEHVCSEQVRRAISAWIEAKSGVARHFSGSSWACSTTVQERGRRRHGDDPDVFLALQDDAAGILTATKASDEAEKRMPSRPAPDVTSRREGA